ncbi:hypothetical protein SBA1_1750005 [Candidatus Sulfotelmatobacter kueseliae]|uniref:Uncharacterized protein n=1 Tax=Candidatus Sulfotelmatobacter kueseliae TaxID=2042962 RepID=A0A2U3KC60_9BACT|nr:hypothetical protein SBA1_1750005 [Candidatus Sulfotelmatobacter kueseliae]
MMVLAIRATAGTKAAAVTRSAQILLSSLAILESATLDFLSLGALVHRLDPGIIPFRKAHECQIQSSGLHWGCRAAKRDAGFKIMPASGVETPM